MTRYLFTGSTGIRKFQRDIPYSKIEIFINSIMMTLSNPLSCGGVTIYFTTVEYLENDSYRSHIRYFLRRQILDF